MKFVRSVFTSFFLFIGNVYKRQTKHSVSQITITDPFKCNINSYFKLSTIIIEYNIAKCIQSVYLKLQGVEVVVSLDLFDVSQVNIMTVNKY